MVDKARRRVDGDRLQLIGTSNDNIVNKSIHSSRNHNQTDAYIGNDNLRDYFNNVFTGELSKFNNKKLNKKFIKMQRKLPAYQN